MKLGIKDRILLLGIIPTQGDIVALKSLRKLREDLAFSEQEVKRFSLVQNDRITTWNPAAKNQEKDVMITPYLSGLIVASLQKMNEQKTLTGDHIDLYELFIPPEK